MLTGAPEYLFYSRRDDEDSLDFAVRLKYRLNLFNAGSASWGLVDDWRPDGSVYKRHGVIIELSIDVSDAILDPGKRAARQRRIREAIDLVQLVIALDPRVIRDTLLSNRRYDRTPDIFNDELSTVARGVPWELRLKFNLYVEESGLFHGEFITNFMENFDQTLSGASFTQQRQELLQALIAHENPTLQRLATMAARSIVRAELKLTTGFCLQDSSLATEDFFEHVGVFLSELDRHQSRRKSRCWRKHAPFRVEAVELEVPSRRKCFGGPDELRKFIQVVTKRTRNLEVSTGGDLAPEVDFAIDADGQNRFERVMMLLKAIGDIPNIDTINVAHLLAVCTSAANRSAVWRGLFNRILGREQPLNRLLFRISPITPQVAFTASDGRFIEQTVAWWRKGNPDKKLRVRHLEIHFVETDMDAVAALLSAFDDVEKITFHAYTMRERSLPSEVVRLMLQYPSIQGVYLTNISIPTLDLFNASIPDSRLSRKQNLRELELLRIDVEDTASVSRFFDALKLTDTVPSEQATKLEWLHVHMCDFHRGFDFPVFEILDNALNSNKTLRHIDISMVCTDPDKKDKAHDILRKHSGRDLSPSAAETVTEVEKTRRTAFLRGVGDAYRRLDSTLVSKIFAFSVPPASPWMREDRHDSYW